MVKKIEDFPLGENGLTLSYKDLRKAWELAEKWHEGSSSPTLSILEQDEETHNELVRECFWNGLIAVDPRMRGELMPEIRLCGYDGSKVLITGETGTGKEVVAGCIHYMGNRKERPFQAINCGNTHVKGDA